MPQTRQFHNAQVFAALQNFHNALFKGGSGHHFKIVGGHHFSRFAREWAVHHHGSAKGGDTVAPEGFFKGHGDAVLAPGCAAGIIVLQDNRSRTIREVLKNVGSVVHIRKVGLAGVFARLNHLGFSKSRNNAVARPAPGQAAARQ